MGRAHPSTAPAPARILDVGGATGAYAGPLADSGHAVHVVDPVPDHVERAAALPGVTAELGDARQLPAPDVSAVFTRAYFHEPREAVPEAAEAGLTDVRVVAVEGPMAFAGPVLDDILADADRTAVLLDRMRGVEADPGILGATGHLLVIGRRGPH